MHRRLPPGPGHSRTPPSAAAPSAADARLSKDASPSPRGAPPKKGAMTDVAEWVFATRDYAAERSRLRCRGVDAAGEHPLVPSQAKRSSVVKKAAPDARDEPAAPDDPLSAMLDPAPRKKALVDAGDDPLSMISGGAAPPPPPERASFLAPEGGPASSSGAETERLGWAAFKQGITREFTGSGSMRIALPSTAYPSSAKGAKDGRDVMDDGEHEQSILAPKAVDKAAARLQQLEQQAAGVANSTVASISSEEYVQHLERLRAQLKKAWANDERVLALKIAIQAAKLLGETAAPAFYPAMFVLTSELLDLFGKLVYDRIRAKADAAAPGRRGLGAAFESRDVCADAKETRRTVSNLQPDFNMSVCKRL